MKYEIDLEQPCEFNITKLYNNKHKNKNNAYYYVLDELVVNMLSDKINVDPNIEPYSVRILRSYREGSQCLEIIMEIIYDKTSISKLYKEINNFADVCIKPNKHVVENCVIIGEIYDIITNTNNRGVLI